MRKIVCLLACMAGGLNLAYAHGNMDLAHDAMERSDVVLAGLGVVVCLALGVGAWNLLRKRLGRTGDVRATRAEAGLVLCLLAILVWTLPWLGFHGTHHALQGGHHGASQIDSDCPIAKIAHNQAGALTSAASAPCTAVAFTDFRYVLPQLVAVLLPTQQARAPPV